MTSTTSPVIPTPSFPLGVQQLAVAVNKLDTVSWSQARFDEIRARLGTFLRSIGFKESELKFVPCSGLTGENLTQPASEPALTAWYTAPTLLQVIGEHTRGSLVTGMGGNTAGGRETLW